MSTKRISFFALTAICVWSTSSCDTALEKPLERDKVLLMAPADSLVTENTAQTFYWEKTDGAFTYQLQVVKPDFNRIEQLIEDTTINTNRFVLDLTKGKYQWRVKAFNNSSATPYSNVNTLYIQ